MRINNLAAVLTAAVITIQSPIVFAEETQQTNYDDAQMWRFTVGAIHLVRDSGSDVGIISDGSNILRNTILTNDDLGNLSSQGIDIGLQKDFGSYYIGFRGIFTAEASVDWSSPNRTMVNGVGAPITADPVLNGIIQSPLDLNAERSTSFHSIELNAGSYKNDNIDLFAGIRALWIEDNLALGFSAAPAGFPQFTLTHDIDVTNRLIGPQIGTEIRFDDFLSPVVDLSVGGKLGYLYNRSDLTADVIRNNAPTPGSRLDIDDDAWTAMAELNVDATIKVTQNMDLEFGYNLVYLNNVGTSTKTLGTLVTAVPPISGSIGRESALYHGFTAKAVWRW